MHTENIRQSHSVCSRTRIRVLSRRHPHPLHTQAHHTASVDAGDQLEVPRQLACILTPAQNFLGSVNASLGSAMSGLHDYAAHILLVATEGHHRRSVFSRYPGTNRSGCQQVNGCPWNGPALHPPEDRRSLFFTSLIPESVSSSR